MKSSNVQLANDEPLGCSSLALEKAKIVAPLRGLRPIPGDKMVEACRAAGELLGVTEGEISHQTIRNWLKTLETEGPQRLDRKMHRNRGLTTTEPQLSKIAKGILLNPKRFSIAEAHRRLERYARNFLTLPEEQIPSRKQIAYIWEHISDEEKVLALEGIQAYRRKYDQCVRFEAPYPNAILQADHHQLDIIVIDPDTREAIGRPWITKIQDDHSRAIMGYYLSMDYPGSMGIASALHHAFLPKPQEWWTMHGLADMAYIDNGKDWISRHIELVALKFGITLQRHEAYHPQSKGKIERVFRTLEQMCIHPLDGSVGSSISTRPHKVTPKLTMEQVRVHIERFIRDYHERVHGTTKQKPRERWEKNLKNHRTVTDLADLDHLLKSKDYTVQRYGIHFQKNYYRDTAGVLGGYIGRRVTVFFDSRDTSRIRIWGRQNADEEPRYICTAHLQSFAPTQDDRASVATKNKHRRDETRKEVRENQAEGKEALKALDELDGKEDIAARQEELPSEPPPQSETAPSSLPNLPITPISRSRNAAPEPDPDDEPDYDELRRKKQRKQREG